MKIEARIKNLESKKATAAPLFVWQASGETPEQAEARGRATVECSLSLAGRRPPRHSSRPPRMAKAQTTRPILRSRASSVQGPGRGVNRGFGRPPRH